MELRDQLQLTLGDAYGLERELGGGGMSRVFVAEERALGRKVAVKVLPPVLSSGVNIERFQREIQVAARLQHAHIVPVLTAGDTNGLPYYTMPFVEGESLRARLERDDALPIGDVVSILRDVARALAYAHERGVVHRDIKPDNVMLSGGSAVVTDFGIAKAISASRTQDGTAGITQVGMSIGTPAYMAPEQAAGDPATDHRADLYAFGCMAFEMLAGAPPFVALSPQQLLAAHMARNPDDVASRRPDTPPALASLVMRCLEKRAEDRPDSAGEITRALEGVTSGGSQPTLPPILLAGPGAMQRALLVYAAAFVAVAALAKAAIAGIGLPDWVFPGALIVMGLGLPAILFTGYVQRVTRRALAGTPTITPGGSYIMVGDGTMATMALKASPHVSWKRTWRASALGLGGFVALVAGFMALRAMGIGPAGSLLASGAFEDREPLLVADFEVAGADSTLGVVLAEALRTSLGESRAVSIVPTSAVTAALQRMQQPAGTPIDLTLARAIAQREGIKAVVTGLIAPLAGDGYAMSVRLVDAGTGDVIASVQETAEGAQGLITAVDKLSRKMRERIGESIRGIQATQPLDQVTTASLDALRKYAKGRRAMLVTPDYDEAVLLSREAIALDTTFAMAYWQLATALYVSGTDALGESAAALEKAYQYRNRLTEQERLLLEAFYLGPVGPHPDRPRQIAAYERLLERYPEVTGSSNSLALLYLDRQQFARAESLWSDARARGEGTLYNWTNPVRARLLQGEFLSARVLLDSARMRFPGVPQLTLFESEILYAEGKLDSAYAAYQQLMKSDILQLQQTGLLLAAALNALRGRAGMSKRWLAEARTVAESRGLQSLFLANSILFASYTALVGDDQTLALETIERALQVVPLESLTIDSRPYFGLARLYAQAGQPTLAREVLARYDTEVTDTVRQRVQRPGRLDVEAWIDMAEGRPRDAVANFRASTVLPDGPANRCVSCIGADVGRAFDRADMPDSAIVALESFVNGHAPLGLEYALRAWATMRLGELYDTKGNRAKAAKYLGEFVELWKDADPELQPAVRQARARLLQLTDPERR